MFAKSTPNCAAFWKQFLAVTGSSWKEASHEVRFSRTNTKPRNHRQSSMWADWALWLLIFLISGLKFRYSRPLSITAFPPGKELRCIPSSASTNHLQRGQRWTYGYCKTGNSIFGKGPFLTVRLALSSLQCILKLYYDFVVFWWVCESGECPLTLFLPPMF